MPDALPRDGAEAPALQLWEPLTAALAPDELESSTSAEAGGGSGEPVGGDSDQLRAPVFECILIFGGIGESTVSGVSGGTLEGFPYTPLDYEHAANPQT